MLGHALNMFGSFLDESVGLAFPIGVRSARTIS